MADTRRKSTSATSKAKRNYGEALAASSRSSNAALLAAASGPGRALPGDISAWSSLPPTVRTARSREQHLQPAHSQADSARKTNSKISTKVRALMPAQRPVLPPTSPSMLSNVYARTVVMT